jgi:hypothetical protein
MIMQAIRSILEKLPPIKQLTHERDSFSAELRQYKQSAGVFPPGHFYSPIPAIDEIKKDEDRIFDSPQDLSGIDLNEKEQLEFLHACESLYDEIPFPAQKVETLRYYFENPNYSYADAIFLYCMIRKNRPDKIIEIGSGFSTCVILDTNELWFDHKINITCIEPYPHLLESLISLEDKNRIELKPNRLQDASLDMFRNLSSGDLLIVDSTHVSKVGSDVNYLFFEILPKLPKGVFIHFHDIYYPFEYPRWVVYKGIVWNEAYLLHAFLQFNSTFKIVLFNTFLEQKYKEYFNEKMPLCMKNPGGSIWLRKEN